MRRVYRQPRLSVDSENPYWVSFSDIMAGLLAIFILALVFLMIRLDQQTMLTREIREQIEAALEDLARIEDFRKQILAEIQTNLAERGIQVEVSENNAVLHIPEEQLHFYSGRYDIPSEKSDTVAIVGEILKNVLVKHRQRVKFIDTIFIEGHTDSIPYDKTEMGNWGLSSYRAISIWKFWTENPGEQQVFLYMKNLDGKPLFSVSGYADTRRIVIPDDTPEARQQNRRIDIRLTMRTPATGDLRKLLERFKNANIR